MKELLLVSIGSFFGGGIRYLAALLQNRLMTTSAVVCGSFPWATFAVNVIGCLLIGLLTGIASSGHLPAQWKLVLVTGFCGGFTTFSTFINENYLLGKDNMMMLAIYTISSLALGMAALIAGYKIASAIIG
ncbi:MAG: CrcB family protein [Prevotella sp.]|nr:CrcB family protein [Prevotella sp.]